MTTTVAPRPVAPIGAADSVRALVWSLLATGYGLTIGLLLQAIMSQHAFSPSRDPIMMLAFIAAYATT